MADLHVSKKNIRSLLSLDDANTKGKTFIIPEYQRPYRWDKDTCDVLWTDFVSLIYNKTHVVTITTMLFSVGHQ